MSSRGFTGRPRVANDRVPPGQYVADDFPVLTAGPTEHITPEEWELTVTDGSNSKTYSWDSLHELGVEEVKTDIHCVTHWTKLDTTWGGISVETVFDDAGLGDYDFALITSYGGYTTNLPTADLLDGDAMIATSYEGEPIEAEHGGPVRLFVPKLYFWKSAKWVTKIEISDNEQQGFWEAAGYHNYGDPWSEQRYYSD